MYLLILESIGTPELILIAIVALIVLGPRKLPQMMKTVGKTMAEFRNATNEFKSTWEREVDFQENNLEDQSSSIIENPVAVEDTVSKSAVQLQTEPKLPTPEVKEISAEDFEKNFANKKSLIEKAPTQSVKPEKTTADKRDWL